MVTNSSVQQSQKTCFGKKLTPHTCANWASNSCNSPISKIPLGQRNSGDLLIDSLCEKSVTNASVQQSQKCAFWQKKLTPHTCANWASNSCNSQISKIPLGQRNFGDLLTDSLCEQWSQIQAFSSHKSMCFGKKLTPHTCTNWASNSCNSQISKIPLGQRNFGDLLTDSLCEQQSQMQVISSHKSMCFGKKLKPHTCANWASNSCNSQISKIPLGQRNSGDLLTDSLYE